MKIFSVHDIKIGAYLPPIFLKSAGEALRAFQATCEDPQTNLYKYPTDFTLVELGEFDETTASICCHTAPRILSHASEYSQKILTNFQISKDLKPVIASLDV